MPLSTFNPFSVQSPLRCLIVEEQLMFQDLLTGMLRLHPGLEVIGAAGTAAAAIAFCTEQRPDLLILNRTLPDGDGFAVVRALQALRPQARVIVLSGVASSLTVPAELRSMITAILDQSRPFLDLLQAVEALLMPQQTAEGASDPLAGLSERERQVLTLIGAGQASRAIALTLNISVHTVDTHRRNIIAKLGINRSALVHQATLLLHSQMSHQF